MLDRTNLYSYQDRIAQFVRDNPFCACWVDMGLGKTVSTETAYLDLLNAFEARRMLVVAPLRVARKVWTDELLKWKHLEGLTVSKIIGTPTERWAAARTPADIHTINRENLPWLMAQFVQHKKQVRPWPWDMVVLDEAQSFRSQGANRWSSARQMRRLCKRMVQLAGTPSPNGYGGLWSQLYLLDHGHRLGSTETAFRDRWFDAERNEENYTRWTLKAGADVAIQRQVADIVISMRAEDYLELPPIVRNVVKVELPAKILEAYKRFERETLLEFKGQTLRGVNAGAVAGKLLQFANGAVYHDDKGNWTHIHDAKVDTLLELLQNIDGPVMICYGFKHDLQRLKCALQQTGERWDVLSTQASEDRWNEGKTKYLLLHPASAGHGLNLQSSGSEAIVWFGLTPDWELYSQANARLGGGHRRTGRNIVIHHILAEGTRDEWMLELLARKEFSEDGLMAALSEFAWLR